MLCVDGATRSLFSPPPGTDPHLRPVDLDLSISWLSLDARRDVSMQPDLVVSEHHAYLSLMTRLAQDSNFDVVHNHSLHYLPVTMAPAMSVPMITTLHTPPTPWLESAVRISGAHGAQFVAVSQQTARVWAHALGPVRSC